MALRLRLIDVKKSLTDSSSRVPTLLAFLLRKNSSNPREILNNACLSLREGEILELVGDNGAGKTTLLRIIAGILTHDSGLIEVRGSVFPVLSLNGYYHHHLSLSDHIIFLLENYGCSSAAIDQKLGEVLSTTRLESRKNENIGSLSPGLTARLLAGVCEAIGPDLILIDEILAQCDARAHEMWLLQLERCRKRGGSAIVVRHRERRAEWADRWLELKDGKLLERT